MESDIELTESQWRILRHLESSSEQIKQTPTTISFNLDMEEDTVQMDLSILLNHDLVRVIDDEDQVYKISPIGTQVCQRSN